MEILDIRTHLKDEKSYLNKNEPSMLLQEISQNPSSSPPTTTTSPLSSPTHEFSFTISLHPHPPPTSTKPHISTTTTPFLPPPPAAIDLSPADDIFFHGHLLPLHHLPMSPNSSTNSIDNFTLPINLLYDQTTPIGNTSFHCHHQTTFSVEDADVITTTATTQNPPSKSKSFSIFKTPKWKKRCDDERESDENQSRERNNYSKKLKLDLGQLVKRYMKMMRPLLSFPKTKRANMKFNHQSYSFSGDCNPPEMNKRRGQLSAPASMRTSPGNSGIINYLGNSGTVSPIKSMTSESSMEELHAAIQAAIAHCKNSIAMEDDKIQSHV